MKSAFLIATILASPGFVSSASAAGGDDPTTAKSDDNLMSERKICTTNRATGSRVRVNRVCYTRAQWDEIQANIRKDMNSISRNNNMGRLPGM